MAHHRETAEQSLYHAGNGVPCRFFNKDTRFDFATNQYLPGCVNGAACPYSHAPTIQSLRLDLFGPNICEGHLVRVGGCPFGPSCVHSHDLERSAALPVDDRDALRATLEYFVRLRKDQRRGLGVRGSVIKAWGGGAPVVQMRGKCGDAILRELGGSRPGDQNADNPTPTTSTFTSRSSFLQTEPYRQEDLDGEDLIRGGHDGEPSEDPGYQR
ncbi:hypothetical protein RQP46_007681 [Phenoliferia psychrophenolica]